MLPLFLEPGPNLTGLDLIRSTQDMVNRADAYIGIFGHRYGHVPDDPVLNAEGRSITEIEYRAAKDRDIPIFIFIMSDDHLVRSKDFDRVHYEKLVALKEELLANYTVGFFDSPEDLKSLVTQALFEFRGMWSTTHGPVNMESGVAAMFRRYESGEILTLEAPPPTPLTHDPDKQIAVKDEDAELLLTLAYRMVLNYQEKPILLRELDVDRFKTLLDKVARPRRSETGRERLQRANKKLENQGAPDALWLAWAKATKHKALGILTREFLSDGTS